MLDAFYALGSFVMLVQVTPQLDPSQLDGGAWQLHAASLPLEHRDADADADADAAGMGAGAGVGVGASSLAEYMQLCMLRSLGRLVLQHALQLQTKGRLAALQALRPPCTLATPADASLPSFRSSSPPSFPSFLPSRLLSFLTSLFPSVCPAALPSFLPSALPSVATLFARPALTHSLAHVLTGCRPAAPADCERSAAASGAAAGDRLAAGCRRAGVAGRTAAGRRRPRRRRCAHGPRRSPI